jgi:quinol-cytochrome oxidoreductase complex cytochrome b subunit
MSWLIVFISLFVPIVLLFILLIMDWLHGSPGRSVLHSGFGAG